ncbi:MAG: hypothetical protein IJY39_09555, partial [Clostridia bacterium]|nr:hypothetical protein [Clostridia bacterium]
MLHIINVAASSGMLALSSPILQLLTSSSAIIFYLVAVLVIIAILILAVIFREPTAAKTEVVIADPAAFKKAENTPEEEGNGERFCMLSEIDRKSTGYGHQIYEKGITLDEICNDFRNYAA